MIKVFFTVIFTLVSLNMSAQVSSSKKTTDLSKTKKTTEESKLSKPKEDINLDVNTVNNSLDMLNKKTADFIESITEKKEKMLVKPQVYISCEEYSEYSNFLKTDVKFFRGQVVKRGYINIYKAYLILKNDTSKDDKTLSENSTIENLTAMTENVFSVAMSESSKIIDKKLLDITNVSAIKKIMNIN